jgi:D-alanyl-D-alanine carboxypeptidase
MKDKIAGAILAAFIVAGLPVFSATPSFFARAAEAAAPAAGVLPKARTIAPEKIVAANGRESLGVKTTAGKIFVVDLVSGSELYSQNSDVKTPIASISKLMTALVLLDHRLDWNAKVTVVKPADGGGLPYFFPGDVVTVRDLWQAMLVGSSNEAVYELVRATGLSEDEFAAEMNAKAAGLGLAGTHFVEPTGLSADNVSSAREVALLLKTALGKKEITSAMLMQNFVMNKIAGRPVRVASTDKLLSSFINKDPYRILGAKTGYIDESGYNLALAVTKGGAGPILVVAIGSATDTARFDEVKSLAYWSFSNYRWPRNLAIAAVK